MAPKKAATGSQQTIWELIQEFAKPSVAASSQQVAQAFKLAHILNDFMLQEIAGLVRDAEDRPMMLYYSSDGTPIKTHLKTTKTIGDLTVRREGKETKEYLAQVLFARYVDRSGNAESRCVFNTTPLTHARLLWRSIRLAEPSPPRFEDMGTEVSPSSSPASTARTTPLSPG